MTNQSTRPTTTATATTTTTAAVTENAPPRCVKCQLRRTKAFTPVKPSGRLFILYSGWAFRYESPSDGRLLTTGRRNATERVAMLLMHLYRRLQRLGLEDKDADGQGGTIEWPINQQRIADTPGLSLVHTNKTLRRLLHLGLHDIQNGRLRLLNPKALERIADYYEQPRSQVPPPCAPPRPQSPNFTFKRAGAAAEAPEPALSARKSCS